MGTPILGKLKENWLYEGIRKCYQFDIAGKSKLMRKNKDDLLRNGYLIDLSA